MSRYTVRSGTVFGVDSHLSDTVCFETFDSGRPARDAVARLILESDPQMNSLVYGADPPATIQRLPTARKTFYLPEYNVSVLERGKRIRPQVLSA